MVVAAGVAVGVSSEPDALEPAEDAVVIVGEGVGSEPDVLEPADDEAL